MVAIGAELRRTCDASLSSASLKGWTSSMRRLSTRSVSTVAEGSRHTPCGARVAAHGALGCKDACGSLRVSCC
jgi:hypothetical protein